MGRHCPRNTALHPRLRSACGIGKQLVERLSVLSTNRDRGGAARHNIVLVYDRLHICAHVTAASSKQLTTNQIILLAELWDVKLFIKRHKSRLYRLTMSTCSSPSSTFHHLPLSLVLDTRSTQNQRRHYNHLGPPLVRCVRRMSVQSYHIHQLPKRRCVDAVRTAPHLCSCRVFTRFVQHCQRDKRGRYPLPSRRLLSVHVEQQPKYPTLTD